MQIPEIEQTEEERVASPTVITMRTAEIAVAVILGLASACTIWSNYQLGAGWGGYGPEPGYFPLRLGVVVLIAAAFVVFHAIRENNQNAFLEIEQAKLVAIILVPLVIFIAAIGFLGIYVASVLFIAAFMLFLGKFPWWKCALVSVLLMAVFFYVFEIQFKVPLPKGPLEAMFGY